MMTPEPASRERGHGCSIHPFRARDIAPAGRRCHTSAQNNARPWRRREVLSAGLAGVAGLVLRPHFAWADDGPTDVRITRITSMELELTRPKHVGKNAYRHDHGTQAFDRVVRLETNAGHVGVATCWSGANELAGLLGKSPLDFFRRADRRIESPLARYTAPLWDLAGRVLGKPVYELLGPPVRETVPAYDGSIYFIDLRPPHLADWPDQFRRELDLSLNLGHRAFKIKVGRGKLWMLRGAGDARDVEVIRLIRKHVGPDVRLAADANDGHTLDTAVRFLEATAECRLDFAEEFLDDDSVDNYKRLREALASRNLSIKLADGENRRLPEQMRPWSEADVIDIFQGDMNLFGFEDIAAEAALVAPNGGQVAPHNWGSLFGYYLQLQAGKVIPNFYWAEQDLLSCKAVHADGYVLKDGQVTVPAEPGLGITLDERALPDVACVHFDLRA